jgi:DNA-binding XRE family transcriptional regulator
VTDVTTRTIDTAALRSQLGPQGPWAVRAGLRVAELRKRQGLSETHLAAAVSVTATTIKQIETGNLVPRDYLRAALAWALGRDVDDIWSPIRRDDVIDMAAEDIDLDPSTAVV